MKTDKELLELAAKVARYDIRSGRNCTGLHPAMNLYSAPLWNPLTNDGDAFRLAVKLNLAVDVSDTWVNIFYNNKVLMASPVIVSEKIEITRRAIVRAAAAIGESK